MIAKVLALVLLAANEVESACTSESYLATTQLQSIYYYHYSNNDNCSINILPNLLYRNGHYLELKWTYIDIEGNLPHCKDYVEVYLTR